jgi:hypothetical protein
VLDSILFYIRMLQERMLQHNIVILQELTQKQDW